MKKYLIAVGLLFCCCIKFKYQTCSWRHDPDSDSLKIFQIYEDISGGGKRITEEEKKELKTILKNKSTYFFSNWLYEYPGLRLNELLAEEKQLTQVEKDFINLLLRSVKVENGDWYTNEKGKLCAWQKVTVHNVRKVLDSGNKVIRDFFLREPDTFFHRLPPDSKYIEIKNNQLIWRIPMKYEKYQKDKLDALNSISEDRDDLETFTSMMKNVQLNYKNSFLEVIVGESGKRVNSIKSRSFTRGEYNDSLKKYISERSELKQGNPDHIQEAFLEK